MYLDFKTFHNEHMEKTDRERKYHHVKISDLKQFRILKSAEAWAPAPQAKTAWLHGRL
jgi:hypothetical protein